MSLFCSYKSAHDCRDSPQRVVCQSAKRLETLVHMHACAQVDLALGAFMWAWEDLFFVHAPRIIINFMSFLPPLFCYALYKTATVQHGCLVNSECLGGQRLHCWSVGGKKLCEKIVTIYTLTSSLGALWNVNLSSHYKMYLSETKN